MAGCACPRSEARLPPPCQRVGGAQLGRLGVGAGARRAPPSAGHLVRTSGWPRRKSPLLRRSNARLPQVGGAQLSGGEAAVCLARRRGQRAGTVRRSIGGEPGRAVSGRCATRQGPRGPGRAFGGSISARNDPRGEELGVHLRGNGGGSIEEAAKTMVTFGSSRIGASGREKGKAAGASWGAEGVLCYDYSPERVAG